MILDIQDIINSVSVPALIKDEFIKKGTFARLKNGDFQICVGGFSVVFPVEVDGSKWAFRCWHHTLDNDQARIKLLSAELKKTGLSYFIDFEYEDKGIVVNGYVFPTTRMKWIKGRDIKDYICYNRNNRHKLFELASNFFAMTQDLHRLSIAHGDLQHENIIVNPYGKIYLIDYDSMYVPALSYMNSKNSTNGKEGYQHPAREKCIYSNPKLDYFSEVIILTSILAIAHNPDLIEKYKIADEDSMLFKKADFRDFSSSRIYSDLSSMGKIITDLLYVISGYLECQNVVDLEPLGKLCPNLTDHLKNYVSLNDTVCVKTDDEAAWKTTLATKTKFSSNRAELKTSAIIKYCLALLGIVVIVLSVVFAVNYGSLHLNNESTDQQEQLPIVIDILPERELKNLESQTEKLINAMEIAKRIGDSRNDVMYRKAAQNLANLKKYGSDKYKLLKDRYETL